MRLENFLFENDIVSKNNIGKIYANCSEIVEIYKKTNKFFYRGLKHWVDKEMVRKTPRLKRNPKDMPIYMHNFLDNYFYEKFGWEARSQGIFASSDYGTASEYGNIHIIFPFDGFEYIWSPIVDDAYSVIGEPDNFGGGVTDYIIKYGPDTTKGFWSKNGVKIKNTKNIVDFSQDFYEYNYDSLDNMFYSVDIKDPDNPDYIHTERWKWIPEITYDEFLLKFLSKELNSYKDTGILQCLSKGNEIMFRCKNYYAVSVNDSITPRSFGL